MSQQYTNEQLHEMIQKAGGVPPRPVGLPEDITTPVGGNVSPVQIMTEVQAQGIEIPWAQIGQFLICVLVGLWTQSLPAAVKSCGLKFAVGRVSSSSK